MKMHCVYTAQPWRKMKCVGKWMDRENRIARETVTPARKDRCCHFLGLMTAGSESLEVNTSPKIRAEARDV